nr:unnamed protein product [Spirometra erinaceieuropaei]
MTTTPPAAIYSPRRTACTNPSSIALPETTKQPSNVIAAFAIAAAGDAEGVDGSQGREDSGICGPQRIVAPSPNADGTTLLTEKTQILQRWAEHIRGVLNRLSTISDAAIARLPLAESNADFDLWPSLHEASSAMQQHSSGKTTGLDAIPVEIYKRVSLQHMDHMMSLYREMWRQGEVPQNFQDATIVLLYKLKDNRQLRDNHRGISPLNIAGKIVARILLNRLNSHL